MNDEEILKGLIEKRDEHLRRAEAYNQAIAALRKGTQMGSGTKESPTPVQIESSMTIRDVIVKAIEFVPQEFTVRDVMEAIETNFPAEVRPQKSSVATIFWKVAQELNCQVVEQGAGRRATLYRKP